MLQGNRIEIAFHSSSCSWVIGQNIENIDFGTLLTLKPVSVISRQPLPQFCSELRFWHIPKVNQYSNSHLKWKFKTQRIWVIKEGFYCWRPSFLTAPNKSHWRTNSPLGLIWKNYSAIYVDTWCINVPVIRWLTW